MRGRAGGAAIAEAPSGDAASKGARWSNVAGESPAAVSGSASSSSIGGRAGAGGAGGGGAGARGGDGGGGGGGGQGRERRRGQRLRGGAEIELDLLQRLRGLGVLQGGERGEGIVARLACRPRVRVAPRRIVGGHAHEERGDPLRKRRAGPGPPGAAGQHLRQGDAQAEEVGARVDAPPQPELGGGVGVLLQLAGRGPEAEAEQARLEPAFARLEQDVVGSDVAVDDAQRVQHGQGFQQRAHQPPGLGRGERSADDQDLPQGVAGDLRAHQPRPAIAEATRVQHRHHVRVGDRPQRARLAREPRGRVPLRGALVPDDLEDAARAALEVLDGSEIGVALFAQQRRDAPGAERRPHDEALLDRRAHALPPGLRDSPCTRSRSFKWERETSRRRAASLTFHAVASSVSFTRRPWKRRIASW